MDELEVLFHQTSYHPDKAISGLCVRNLSDLVKLEEIPLSTTWPGMSVEYPFQESGRTRRTRWKTRPPGKIEEMVLLHNVYRECFFLSGTYNIIYNLTQRSKVQRDECVSIKSKEFDF